MVSIDEIKELREQTGVSISECKKALEESNGDYEKAKEILRKWGKELAGKKSSREAREGIIDSYIHPNKKIGVLLDIRCETDFVGKSEDFTNLAHEICLHIAASKPLFLKEEDIPEEFLDGEKKIYTEQLEGSGKPENIVNQVLEGKLKKYKEGICLMSQPWIKDDSKTIKDLVSDYIAKIGENIEIKEFKRFEI
jgi:elongation factor Ts